MEQRLCSWVKDQRISYLKSAVDLQMEKEELFSRYVKKLKQKFNENGRTQNMTDMEV